MRKPPILSRMRRLSLSACVLGLLVPASAAEFTPLTPLPDQYHLHGLAESNGYLYHTGGLSGTVGVAGGRKTLYAKLEAASLGAWLAGPDLPEVSFSHASASHNGTLYLVGGQRFRPGFGVGPSDTVYHSKLGADGAPGPWVGATPLPKPAFFLNVAIWGGRLYVTGGWNGAGLLPDVYSAPVQADGSLGAWRAETPLPEGVYTHAAAAEGTLYVLGGVVSGGSEVSNEVLRAPIGADGALGAWTQTTPLPRPLANLGSAISNGRIYVTGGWTGTEASSAVYSAAILPDKSLGEWESFAHMPTGRHRHATAAGSGRLFVTGGIGPTPLAEALAVDLPVASVAPALIAFAPPVLNLSSKGRWIGAFIAFQPSAGSAEEVDPDSVAIVAVNGAPIAPIEAERGQADEEAPDWGVTAYKAKFDRVRVAAALQAEDNVVTVAGRFTDGRAFAGHGRIWGKERKPLVTRRAKNAAELLKLAEKAAQKPMHREGGELRAGRAGVRLPEGSIDGGVPVTVHEEPPEDRAAESRRLAAATKKGLEPVGAVVEYGPHGTRFAKPVTLELPYERERLPGDVKESELAVHYWNQSRGEWEALPSIVDTAARVVRAQTTHFSQYQVLSGGNVPAAATGFGEVYAYPNPARGGANPVIRVEAPGADTVRVRIYDVGGARRHEVTLTGAAAAHETAWDVSGIGSGIYYYVVEASGGGSIVRKTGKLAVIK